MSITPDLIKISAPDLVGRCTTVMRSWPHEQKSKPEVNSRDVIKLMSETKGPIWVTRTITDIWTKFGTELKHHSINTTDCAKFNHLEFRKNVDIIPDWISSLHQIWWADASRPCIDGRSLSVVTYSPTNHASAHWKSQIAHSLSSSAQCIQLSSTWSAFNKQQRLLETQTAYKICWTCLLFLWTCRMELSAERLSDHDNWHYYFRKET